jgi:hypothetical protein
MRRPRGLRRRLVDQKAARQTACLHHTERHCDGGQSTSVGKGHIWRNGLHLFEPFLWGRLIGVERADPWRAIGQHRAENCIDVVKQLIGLIGEPGKVLAERVDIRRGQRLAFLGNDERNRRDLTLSEVFQAKPIGEPNPEHQAGQAMCLKTQAIEAGDRRDLIAK